MKKNLEIRDIRVSAVENGAIVSVEAFEGDDYIGMKQFVFADDVQAANFVHGLMLHGVEALEEFV